jgi:hypothetical protein
MRSLLLISLNAFNKQGLKKEMAGDEEEKSGVSKKKDKKGKGKKKGEESQKVFNPFDVNGLIVSMNESVELIEKS